MKPGNVLFIMCDQLRWDYLSCAGHPSLQTPNIDALAQRGVQFTQAFCQAPLCGPSRASFYTGRYMSSHGAMANCDLLKPGELTLGDYLATASYRTALVGKTHTSSDYKALQQQGFVAPPDRLKRLATGGFEPYTVHEGLYPDQLVPSHLAYNQFLTEHGYAGSNPWQSAANAAIDENGQTVDGHLLRNANYPANVQEAHSETAFLTNRAIDFISEACANDEPWCLHLSYIKPHWPLIAPAPYNAMYSAADSLEARRHQQELMGQHPVVKAFRGLEYSQNYSKDAVRDTVIPTYMGLVKQIDDHLGRLFHYLEESGLKDNTMVIFTSDHGDYLGDHWLGEKDLFHDCSSKIPLIICDPRPSADSTRGTQISHLVEAIDVLPSIVDFAGVAPCKERVEGTSLLPMVSGEQPITEREYVISEIDYSDRGARNTLGVDPYLCRAYMLRTKRWKFIFYEGFAPQLFDLNNDPDEFFDVAGDSHNAHVLTNLQSKLFTWLRTRKQRTQTAWGRLEALGPELDEQNGIVIGRF